MHDDLKQPQQSALAADICKSLFGKEKRGQRGEVTEPHVRKLLIKGTSGLFRERVDLLPRFATVTGLEEVVSSRLVVVTGSMRRLMPAGVA
jgi:hypothetical protein